MKRQQGVTFIELIAFIIILGIITAGSIMAFKTVLRYSNRAGQILVASQLADARMSLIILQRQVNGFALISDPCSTGSLAACAGLNTFATTYGYVVSSSIPAAVSGVQTATVTVTGTANATNVVRFVQ